jgi:hypothetical protein
MPRDGCTARHDHSHPSTQALFDRTEDQVINSWDSAQAQVQKALFDEETSIE